MSSFLASFFQSSSSGSSKKDSRSTNHDNDHSRNNTSTGSTTNEAAAIRVVVGGSTSAAHDDADDSNHDNNDLVYLDTTQPQDSNEGELDDHQHQQHQVPKPPPPRYFATHLPPPVPVATSTITGTTTKQQQQATTNNHAMMNIRNRSMSKLFTTLPNEENEQRIPTYQQMMIDWMEYIMYIILLETDITKTIHVHSRNLMKIVQSFRSSTSTNNNSNMSHILQPSSHNHRLSNRMMITAFTCDILQLYPTPPEDTTTSAKDETDDYKVPATAVTVLDLPSEGWMELKKRLRTLKNQLLKVSANDDPLVRMDGDKTTTGGIDKDSNDTTMIDEQLSNHMMMTIDYDTVMTLLSVQQVLATFREQLEDIKDDDQDDEEEGDDDEIEINQSIRSINSNKSQNMNKLVQNSVNEFMKKVSELFPPTTTSNEDMRYTTEEMENEERLLLEIEEEEDGDEDYVAEGSERTKTMSNQTKTCTGGTINIPHELHSLALIELYSPKKQNHPLHTSTNTTTTTADDSNNNLVDRLLNDIRAIVTASTGRFSFTNLIDKVRSLLLKWCQSILDVPTLVRLGYGGVPSPIVEKEEDDVSSWGSNNNNYMLGGNTLFSTTTMTDENKQQQQQQQRRKSRNYGISTRPSAAASRSSLNVVGSISRQHRNYSITAEEEDIIARLAATTEAAAKSAITEPQQLLTSQNIESPVDTSDIDNNGDDDIENQNIVADNNSHRTNHTPVVRKVIKASRRLLSSFNYTVSGASATIFNLNKDSSTAVNRSSIFTANKSISKKRTIADCMDDSDYLSISLDDTERPEKIRRRNNVWAANQRMKMRTNQNTSMDSSPLIKLSPIHGNNSTGQKRQTTYATTGSTPSKGHISPAKGATSSSTKKQQTRTAFTDIEVQALMDGINKYGAGKWSKIQKNDIRLKYRTSIQLKDKYRNICRLTTKD